MYAGTRYDSNQTLSITDNHMEFSEPSELLTPGAARLVNRLRLKHLELLALLGDTPVLHVAAKQLNVSQPATTKMLADLETTFGFALFERHARGLRATPLGQQVVDYARAVRRMTTAFVEDLDNRRRGGGGRLVVGAIMGSAPDVLAQAVAQLKARRPLLHLRIVGETSDQIVELLEQGEIELAVGRPARAEDLLHFSFTPLANEQMVLAVRRGHPLLRGQTLDLPTLVPWPWVLQPPSSPSRQLFETELALAGVASPANVVECSSVFAVLQLIQETDSVAAVSESVVRDHVRAGLIAVLPLRFGQELRSFGILSRRGEALSEAAQDFAGCLREVARTTSGGAAEAPARRGTRGRKAPAQEAQA
ncbi:MAG: hypothetical protein RLZ83_408 [Pseudomonadota bacterium]|jgi:DNA-binding transcriptional LysR family regulator